MSNSYAQMPVSIEERLKKLDTDFSKEKKEKLESYAKLLLEWNKTHNLIAKGTEAELWTRHILDSAILLPYLPKTSSMITDFGSGAGFPGLVVAMLTQHSVHLVESNHKKCAFIQEVARITSTSIALYTARVEDLTPWHTDIITCRAFAPTEDILRYSVPFLHKNLKLLLLKGKNYSNELEEAKMAGFDWEFEKFFADFQNTEPDGRISVIVQLTHIKKDK